MEIESKSPVCVFALDSNFREPNLEEILCREDVKNLRVVVISVAGRFRQGKSFLLNFMIRYLRAGGKFEWSSGLTGDLQGFEWKNTRHRVTNGVLIWPEVFKLSLPSGEAVAVVLMDTQGVFDTETTVKDSTRIFSFSVLSSSVQVFNLKQQINGDDLSHLELFSQYGKLLLHSKSESEPVPSSTIFQDVVFLIRDWSYASTTPYGWQGGQSVLEEELNEDGLDGELSSMRRNIKNSFSSFRCFLMPYPGDVVNTSQEFRGNYKDMKIDFLENMQLFLEGLLSLNKLVPKEINNNHVTLQEWCSYVEVYGRHLRSVDLPAPKTLFHATMDATNTTVLKTCTDFYYNEMVNLLDRGTYEERVLLGQHREFSDKAVAMFRASLKMGNQDLWRALENELIKKMACMFEEQFSMVNQKRLQMEQIASELESHDQECERLREQANIQTANTEETKKRLAQLEAESARDQECERHREEAKNQMANTEEIKKRLAQLEAESARDQECERLRKEVENQKAITEEIEKRLALLEVESAVAKQKFNLAMVESEAQLREAKNKKNWFSSLIGGVVDIVKSLALGLESTRK